MKKQQQQQQQLTGRRKGTTRTTSSSSSSTITRTTRTKPSFLKLPSSVTVMLMVTLLLVVCFRLTYSPQSWWWDNDDASSHYYETLVLLGERDGAGAHTINASSSSSAVTTSSRFDEEDKDTLSKMIKPRAYEKKRWSELPCYPPEPNMFTKKLPATQGFVFVKTYKTGSSTASGINLRIARNVAARRLSKNKKRFDICRSRFDHAPAYKKYSKLDKTKSVLWTVVREPTNRFVSQFFHFMVTRRGLEPTSRNLQYYIREGHKLHVNMVDHHYLKFLSLQQFNFDQDDNAGNPISVINQILQDYDFIAITERMDESAVVLSLLLKIPLADVLYLSAKEHGGYDDAGGGDLSRTCKVIQPSFVSNEMQAALQSDEWQNKVKYDRMLYEAANRSLDMTIEQTIGRDVFEKKLKLFEQAKQLIQQRCGGSKTVFPCTGGKYHGENETDCMWNDSACGMDCIDTVAKELHLF